MSSNDGMKYLPQWSLNNVARKSLLESMYSPVLCFNYSRSARWGPDGGKTLMSVFRRLRSPAGVLAP